MSPRGGGPWIGETTGQSALRPRQPTPGRAQCKVGSIDDDGMCHPVCAGADTRTIGGLTLRVVLARRDEATHFAVIAEAIFVAAVIAPGRGLTPLRWNTYTSISTLLNRLTRTGFLPVVRMPVDKLGRGLLPETDDQRTDLRVLIDPVGEPR